jgi:hypothetical protein
MFQNKKDKFLSQGFASGKSEMGIRTTAQTKKLGCAVLKRLVEEDKILLNDERIYSRTYVICSLDLFTYKAEAGTKR